MLRAILAEPLLHFVLIGAALFAIDARERDASNDREIVVSELLREELAQGWEATHGSSPSEPELDRLVESWITEEVLYREGLERGFAEHDPAVRARVASQMAGVLRSRLVVPEPSDAELRAYYEAHRDRWSRGLRVDFTHVFVAGTDDDAQGRARELLELLRSGASPAGLGDRFSGGRRYRQREVEHLEETFGEPFTSGLDAQPPGEWQLRESRFGLHLVRVDGREAAVTPSFDEVRADVRTALVEEREEAMLGDEIDALRAEWEIARR